MAAGTGEPEYFSRIFALCARLAFAHLLVSLSTAASLRTISGCAFAYASLVKYTPIRKFFAIVSYVGASMRATAPCTAS